MDSVFDDDMDLDELLTLGYEEENKYMTIIMVDIESDGPIPHDYSMISFGAVVVDQALDKTFYGQLKPISESGYPKP